MRAVTVGKAEWKSPYLPLSTNPKVTSISEKKKIKTTTENLKDLEWRFPAALTFDLCRRKTDLGK